MDTKYVVHWEYIAGPAVGFGGKGLPHTKDVAEAWVDDCNKRYSGLIRHWIEPATAAEITEQETHNG